MNDITGARAESGVPTESVRPYRFADQAVRRCSTSDWNAGTLARSAAAELGMPFDVHVEDGVVLICHRGDVSADESAEARDEALRLTRLNRLSRVVVDMRGVTNVADSQELRSFMESNADVKPPRPHAAIVVREDQYPLFRFIEDFAVGRGMPIRVFKDENEALTWLAD